MRALVMLALLGGCGFHVAGGADPGDAATGDTALDDTRDANGLLPACMTSPSYAEGPEPGHRYRRIDERDRDGAVDACNADGAHLAVVETAVEDGYLRTLAGTSDVWIGFDDLQTEGTFRWITNALATYEHFEGTEPNDSGVEDCTYLRGSDGTWNDTNCGEQRKALCECQVTYTPPPTPVCRAMPGVTHNGRKYLIHEGGGAAKSWTAAKADCEAVGAHLPVFADREEEGPVNQEFSGENWMGLTDAAQEGKFVWLDGTVPPNSSIHWNITSPHTGDTARNCVRVDIDWEDDACTDLHEYACECEP